MVKQKVLAALYFCDVAWARQADRTRIRSSWPVAGYNAAGRTFCNAANAYWKNSRFELEVFGLSWVETPVLAPMSDFPMDWITFMNIIIFHCRV